ncbi:MAG: ATP-binding protein [Atopobiaceae bacterium]|nr:ATP-binding protein [Atopobiaceae bacterium]
MPVITKIAITGGPCAGKTSALASIRTQFSKLGYKVITLPEPATELIGNGVTPWECSSAEEYQRCQMEIQLVREDMYLRAAQGMREDRILIVCDRGMLDNKCYMSADEFDRVIADLGYTEDELCRRYDAVFHLVSAAKGAEEYYGTASNGVRYESLEEAAALDDRFIEAWSCHPYLRTIGNETDFGDKLRRLDREIASFLGETLSE